MNYSPKTTEEDIADLKARIAADVARRAPTEERQRIINNAGSVLKRFSNEARKDLIARVGVVAGIAMIVGTAMSVANN